MPGRYGPYVKWGKVNATLPKGAEPESITLDEALALIAEKAGKSPKKPARKTAKASGEAKPKAAAKSKPKATKATAAKTAATKSPKRKAAAEASIVE
jgi:DNA topoisomerase-1